MTSEPIAASVCAHGALPGECVDEGCLYRREVKNALLGLAGSMAAAGDQAQAMTDAELGDLLLTGKWTTIEVHEAGRRLAARAADVFNEGLAGVPPSWWREQESVEGAGAAVDGAESAKRPAPECPDCGCGWGKHDVTCALVERDGDG